ncbi:putative membrane protein [Clostridium bornimense]|uniref:Putative membrane protein n=1 Tax=Clostridium bornimense TaxID=1216932 RepID=W6S5U1_9CLOT|nr:hypothetical protein [Clostridium bornimense]CDM69717.1 putative membrane protein [Clostridium bornimense]
MKKKFFIALISIFLISVTLTACGKESSKKNTTSSKPKVEESKEDDSKEEESLNEDSDTDVSEESDSKSDNTETSSKEQENIIIENTLVNSAGDNSNARPSNFYIEELISNYEQLVVDANNNGDFSIVSSMIIQDSNFYMKQKEAIESSYNNNVKYNLLNYSIDQIKEVDNKTYKIYVVENLQVKEGNDANFQDKQFKHIYTIKLDDSGIGINNKEEWN